MGRGAFGHIERRPSGKWRARYTIPRTNRQVSKTFRTKQEAAAWLSAERVLLDSGKWTLPRQRQMERAKQVERDCIDVSFRDLAEDWLQAKRDRGLAYGTLLEYESNVYSSFMPAFDLPLSEIDEGRIRLWYEMYKEEHSAATVVTRYRRLKQIFQTAVDSGLMDVNPCGFESVRDEPVQPVTSDVVATPEQIKALAGFMPEGLGLTVLLAGWCALRRSEILGLQRRCFEGLDSDNPLLVVDGQILKNGVRGATKNKRNRVLSIPIGLVPVIVEHLATHVGDCPQSWVFDSGQGRAVSRTKLHSAWDGARKAAGMGHFRFHDLRHTGLTLYAQQGATYAELLHRGGHTDISVALRYQHWSVERDRVLTGKLNNQVVV